MTIIHSVQSNTLCNAFIAPADVTAVLLLVSV